MKKTQTRPKRTDPRTYVTLRDGLDRKNSRTMTLQGVTFSRAVKMVEAIQTTGDKHTER